MYRLAVHHHHFGKLLYPTGTGGYNLNASEIAACKIMHVSELFKTVSSLKGIERRGNNRAKERKVSAEFEVTRLPWLEKGRVNAAATDFQEDV
ncbi:hypothetical protein D5086_028820 [Populus alba]|uniref:Uncharacterized protein n=1 Tax=Populus alba TaxID=43335 RepID=A0ACC4ARS7_POPAL